MGDVYEFDASWAVGQAHPGNSRQHMSVADFESAVGTIAQILVEGTQHLAQSPRPTRFALEAPQLQQNYDGVWAGFRKHFTASS